MGPGTRGDGFRGRAGTAVTLRRNAATAEPLAPISERLFEEFGSAVSLPEILAVLRQCRQELDTAPTAALPELCERLARERLQVSTATGSPGRPVEGSGVQR